MAERVVTELVIDGRPAKVGADEYSAAMVKAEAATKRLTAANDTAQAAIERQTVVMTQSVGRQAAAFNRLAAAADPVIAATQKLERATIAGNAALAKGAITQDQYNATLAAYRERALAAETATRGLSTAFATLKNFAAGFGIGIGIGLLTEIPRAFQDIVKSSADLVDTADKIGVTTKALQELHFAAGQSGVSIEEMDKGLAFFSRQIGEASRGSGDLFDILKANSVALRDQAGNLRPLQDLLGDYADLVANAASSEERATLVSKGLSKAADGLINTFAQGRAGLTDYARQADDLNIIIGDQLLRNAAEVDDAFQKFASILDTQVKVAVLETVAAIEAISTQLQFLGGLLASFGGGPAAVSQFIAGKIVGDGGPAEITANSKALDTLTGSVDKYIATANRIPHVTVLPASGNAKADPNATSLTRGLRETEQLAKATFSVADALKLGRSSAEDFTQTLVQGLIRGNSLLESAADAASSLSSQLANGALTDLFSGNFVSAGIKGIGALIAGIFGNKAQEQDDAQKKIEAAKKAWHDLSGELDDFVHKMSGHGGGSLSSAIRDITEETKKLTKAAKDAGESVDAIQKAAAKGKAQAVADFTGGLQSNINAATGKSYLNDIADLVAQNKLDVKDAKKFGVDQNLVRQSFVTQAQAIIDSAQLTGAAFNDLIKKFPQLTGAVHQFAGGIDEAAQAAADAAKQLQDSINKTAGSIVDYVNGLNAGPNSTLSPQDRLIAAQGAYNSQIALAQGGNADAQASITQYADDLLKAARDFYASSQGYQDIFAAVKEQLLALPAVQQTDDPVVIALRDAITAINATTSAVTGGSADMVAAIQLIGSPGDIAGQLIPKFDQLDSSINGLLDAGELAAATGGLASAAQINDLISAIDTDGNGQLSKLELIRAATAGTQTSVSPLQQSLINLNASDVALNKSVGTLNTSVTSLGTKIDKLIDSEFSIANQSVVKVWAKMILVLRDIDKNTSAKNKVVKDPVTGHSLTTSDIDSGNPIGKSLGGWVTGGIAGRDSVPTLLMPGEFVVNARVARSLGSQLDALNRGHRILTPANSNLPSAGASISSAIAAGFSGARVAGSDRQNFIDMMRTQAATSAAIIAALKEENAMLRATLDRHDRNRSSDARRTPMPGAGKQAKVA